MHKGFVTPGVVFRNTFGVTSICWKRENNKAYILNYNGSIYALNVTPSANNYIDYEPLNTNPGSDDNDFTRWMTGINSFIEDLPEDCFNRHMFEGKDRVKYIIEFIKNGFKRPEETTRVLKSRKRMFYLIK